MKVKKKYVLGLLALGALLSCARIPQQIVSEKPDALTVDSAAKKVRNSAVRVVSSVGTARGQGSGFFVAHDKIATNIHVVSDYGPIFAESADKKTTWLVEGVVAFDVKNDLVVLKLAGEGTPLSLGDSAAVKIDDAVSVVGFPSEKYKVTHGTVQNIRSSDKWIFLKTDAPRGSSGGPVLNSAGQVIGVVVGYGDHSHKYVIPTNVLKPLLAQLDPIEPLVEWHDREKIRSYTYYVHGEMKNDAGAYDEAIVALDKAIQLNAAFIYPYYKRGFAKFKLGVSESDRGNKKKAKDFYESAIGDFTHIIKQDRDDVDAYNDRAVVQVLLGESEAASGNIERARGFYELVIKDCTYVIKLNPEHVDAYNNRGVANLRLGESEATHRNVDKAQRFYEAAIEDYTHIIKRDPEDAYAYNNRGYAKYLLGKSEALVGNMVEARNLYQAAVIDGEESIRLDPDNAALYHTRGVSKAALGDLEGAIVDFDKAIQINPEYTEAYNERGRAKEALGQQEAAEADFEKAKELDPRE